jgi:hypothetical protein
MKTIIYYFQECVIIIPVFKYQSHLEFSEAGLELRHTDSDPMLPWVRIINSTSLTHTNQKLTRAENI